MRVQIQCDCAPEPVLVEAEDAEAAALELAQEHACPCHVLGLDGTHQMTVTPQHDERGSPPSTYAVLAALEKQPGAWQRVAWCTLVRVPFLALGMRLAGVKGWRLWLGATAGSSVLTGALFALYGYKRRKRRITEAAHA